MPPAQQRLQTRDATTVKPVLGLIDNTEFFRGGFQGSHQGLRQALFMPSLLRVHFAVETITGPASELCRVHGPVGVLQQLAAGVTVLRINRCANGS